MKIKLITTPETLHLAVSLGAEPKLSYLLLYSCLGISALTDLRNRAPCMTMEVLYNISPSCVHSRSDSERFAAFSNLTFPMSWKFQVPVIVFPKNEDRPCLGESNQSYLLTCKASK